MRIAKTIIAAFFLSLGSAAQAGDPCPINVNITDLGSPDWLDNLALINALESRQTWVGISFETSNEGLNLTRVFEGSPAENAGLLAGDLVTAIGALSALDAEAFSSLNIGETVWFTIVRNGRSLTIPLTVGGVDPVPLAIVHQLQNEDCRDSEFVAPNKALQRAVMAAVFTQSRGFRCEDAHVASQSLMEQYQSDTVYFVRGSRRVLLTMPHYGSTCVSAGALDGNNLNDAEIGAVIERVIRNYVIERHENP